MTSRRTRFTSITGESRSNGRCPVLREKSDVCEETPPWQVYGAGHLGRPRLAVIDAQLGRGGIRPPICWPNPILEAAETSLKTRWRPEPGGYEVDRQEKHTGNQSIKLAATVAGVAKGASYCSPATRSRHRARSWSPLGAKRRALLEKDDAYAIYIDVNYADGTNLHQVTAQLAPGSHDRGVRSRWSCRSPPVARFSINLLPRRPRGNGLVRRRLRRGVRGRNAEVRGRSEAAGDPGRA